jgi:threonine dehydrogenase-like Zn-dependent dehydrogenase
MKQLTCVKPRQLVWWDVAEPSLQSAQEALVRPFIAARCDGDAVFLRHDYERLLRLGAALHLVDASFKHARDDVFHGPFAYGHECVAEVVAVGEGVRNVRVNDVVIVPWAISCGACSTCGRGFTSNCEASQPAVAAYGFGKALGEYGGMVSDLVRIPFADAMLVPVPDTIDPLLAASASDNMPDAYRAVGPPLAKLPGAPVLIVGGAAKSVGLYAAGMAVSLGASRVDYVDTRDERLTIAERFGARAIKRERGARWFREQRPLAREGYPITVDASGQTDGLSYALRALSPGGTCTALAFYVRSGTPLPLWNIYMKSTTLQVGISHPRVHLPAVLAMIESGAFDPSKLSPLLGGWSDADRILLEPATKVIVQRARLGSPASSPLRS